MEFCIGALAAVWSLFVIQSVAASWLVVAPWMVSMMAMMMRVLILQAQEEGCVQRCAVASASASTARLMCAGDGGQLEFGGMHLVGISWAMAALGGLAMPTAPHPHPHGHGGSLGLRGGDVGCHDLAVRAVVLGGWGCCWVRLAALHMPHAWPCLGSTGSARGEPSSSKLGAEGSFCKELL